MPTGSKKQRSIIARIQSTRSGVASSVSLVFNEQKMGLSASPCEASFVVAVVVGRWSHATSGCGLI